MNKALVALLSLPSFVEVIRARLIQKEYNSIRHIRKWLDNFGTEGAKNRAILIISFLGLYCKIISFIPTFNYGYSNNYLIYFLFGDNVSFDGADVCIKFLRAKIQLNSKNKRKIKIVKN